MNTKIDEEIFTLYLEFFRGAKIAGDALILNTPTPYINYGALVWAEIRLEILKKYRVI